MYHTVLVSAKKQLSSADLCQAFLSDLSSCSGGSISMFMDKTV